MERIADFNIVRELGRGGMGVVYEAVEEPLGRRVALKLLHPEWATQQDASARFVDEAKKIAKLSHPFIIKVYRFGQWNDHYFLALEYVEGAPLDEALTCQRLSLDKSVSILRTIAEALGHAHGQGIVHRDIKPGNIFVREDGSAVLGDFGIAKDLGPEAHTLTQTGQVIGTPAYMSPEQARALPVTPATDVYALGILAFEMLTGRVPFTADTAFSLLMKHVNEPPPPIIDLAPGVPRLLAALVERMLEKEPSLRPANGVEVASALAAIQRELEAVVVKTTLISGESERVSESVSSFDELDITAACFKLMDFSKDTCQNLLPARVAFLLESWYRLVRQAVYDHGGVVDRYVGGKATALFGYPQQHRDHAQRALRAAQALDKALDSFNRAHDLQLRMQAGIACGAALVGRVNGDPAQTSVQGALMGDVMVLTRTKGLPGAIRLNRAAYRRAADQSEFTQCEISRSNGPLAAWVIAPKTDQADA